MIPATPDYSPRLKKLVKELERIDAIFYATEMKCFRIFEHARPFTLNPAAELEELERQEKELLAFFGVAKGNVAQLFQQGFKDLKVEENDKRQQLARLQAVLALAERDHDELARASKRKVTIHGSLSDFRAQFDKLRDYYEGFKLEISAKIAKMRSATDKMIKAKKAAADGELKRLNDEIAELQEKKEWYLNIPKYVKEHSAIVTHEEFTFTIEPDFSKIDERTTDARKQCEAAWNRHKNFSYDFTPITNKLNDLQRNIDRVSEKTNKLSEILKEKNSIRISRNWIALAFNLLKVSRHKSAIEELTQELAKEEKEIKAELDKQTKIANQIVPGTNMTVLQMRRQIVQLSREVSEETKKLNEQLIQTEEEHRKYEENARKTIENLEKQTNTVKEDVK